MYRTRTSRLLAIPVFVAAIGVSPAIFGADAGGDIDDAAITARVKAAIIADPELQLTLVNVAVDDGAVQLSGVVHTKDQETDALRIAHDTEGVKSVEDHLEVKAPQAE